MASGMGQTFPHAIVPCIRGGHQSFRRMWSRHEPAPLPMIRLGTLVAVQTTALTFALDLRPSEALRFVSRSGGASSASGRPHPGLEHPGAPPRAGHEPKASVYDESWTIQVRGEALRLLNLLYFNWTTVFTTAACDLRFERFGPRRHVARSFHCPLRRDRNAEKRPLKQLQWATSVREGGPHPTIAPNAGSSRASMVSEACRQSLAQLLSARCLAPFQPQPSDPASP